MKKLFLLGVLAWMALASCSGKTEPPETGMVIAYIYHFEGDEDEIDVFLYSDPMADASECRLFLNNWELDASLFRYYNGAVYYGARYIGFGFKPGFIIELSLESDQGNCNGSLNLPDTLSFLSPSDSDTVNLGDINLAWTRPQNADFYDFWVKIVGYSPSGDSLDYRIIAFFTQDTSYTIPGDSLVFSGNFGYSEVLVDIDPCAGVMPAPGAATNMSGDLKGRYYLNNTTSHQLFFYAGTPVKTHGISSGKSTKDFRNRVERGLGLR